MDRQGARLQLKTKEFERDVALPIPRCRGWCRASR